MKNPFEKLANAMIDIFWPERPEPKTEAQKQHELSVVTGITQPTIKMRITEDQYQILMYTTCIGITSEDFKQYGADIAKLLYDKKQK